MKDQYSVDNTQAQLEKFARTHFHCCDGWGCESDLDPVDVKALTTLVSSKQVEAVEEYKKQNKANTYWCSECEGYYTGGHLCKPVPLKSQKQGRE